VKKRFSEEQIIGFLREAESGLPVKELCRWHGFSEISHYLWRNRFGGMTVSDVKRLRKLETENTQLKKLMAESMLEIKERPSRILARLTPSAHAQQLAARAATTTPGL
jgi:putative transposase